MRRNAIALLAQLLCCITAGAQVTTGSVRGLLRSPDEGPVSGASVTATSPDLLGMRHARSAGDGVFQLLSLPPGKYTLRVTSLGFAPVVIPDVIVQLGETRGLSEIPLERATTQLGEVRIVAARATVDPERTTVGATLHAADYAAIPAERDYKAIIAIVPHVNASHNGDAVNAGGSTGLENMYFIDGVNVTAPWQAGTATSLPSNFIRSVEVRTGGYEAQYGRALGAIVNAITYTGTNDLETNVFAFVTLDALTASPRAEPTLRETGALSADVGARVSGPVIRDRLWFSAAYNPRVDRARRAVGTLGTFSDVRRADVFAGKLTWQPRPTANVELSILGDPTTHRSVSAEAGNGVMLGYTPLNIDPYQRLIERGGVSAALRATGTLGPSALIEASLSRYDGKDRDGGATERGRNEITVRDDPAQTIEGGSPFPLYISQSRTTATSRATITSGRHTVTTGFEHDVGVVKRSSGNIMIWRSGVNQYLLDSQWVKGTFRAPSSAAYLQDSWRLSDGLTANVGLRWSAQRPGAASGATSQRLADEWQPRLGFNWQIGKRGTRRVFGSFGRFYQQLPLNMATIFFADSRAKYEYYSEDPRRPGATPDGTDDFSLSETTLAGRADGRHADHFDEFTAGYERSFDHGARLTVRGIGRSLRSAFLIAFDPSRPPGQETFVVGTPGEGELAFLPPARRRYRGLELSLEGSVREVRYRASYVLSRTSGNYTGLFSSDGYFANPGTNFGLAVPSSAINSTGLLPNDRTNVMKITAVRTFFRTFEAGGFGTWQSGTPTNDLGVAAPFFFPLFLATRGSVGRSPAIWDANLRLSHDATWLRAAKYRIILDVLHLGNPRKAVRINQQHYFGVDAAGNQTTPNPNYLSPLLFQPPMSARLGVEATF